MKAITYTLLSVLLLAFSCITTKALQLGPYELSTGFDARDHPRHEEAGSPSRKASSSLKIELHPRVFWKLSNDNFVSKKRAEGGRFSGVGNTWLTFNVDAMLEDKTGVRNNPSLSFIYTIKLPTGSPAKKLGTGRVDHELVASIGKSVGKPQIINGEARRRTSLGVDFGLYSAGKPGQSGFTNVGELTLSVNQVLDDLSVRKYKYHGEIYMSSPAKDTLSEIYAKNDLTIKLSSTFRTKIGIRTGLTPNSPRIGVYGSITYAGNFRPKPPVP